MKSPVHAEQRRQARSGLRISHDPISARSHKVSKSKVVEIPLKRHTTASHCSSPSLSTPSYSSTADVNALAKQLKQRLMTAMTKITPLHQAASTPGDAPPLHKDDDDLLAQQTTLSSADWTSNKSTLHNLDLLKKYLVFVSHEGTLVDINHTAERPCIRLTIPRLPDTDLSTARSGANLIETMVHSTEETDRHLDAMRTKPQVCRTTPDSVRRASVQDRHRRLTMLRAAGDARPTLLPKGRSRHFRKNKKKRHTKTMAENTSDSGYSSSSHGSSRNNPSSAIHCICDTPHEEFGSMVQCDDCSCWLHLDCLKLNDHSLEETFRCPSCSLSLGANKNAKLSGSLSWRFAAQLKSRRLAALSADVSSDEEDDSVDAETKTIHLDIGSDLGRGSATDTYSSPPDWADTVSEPSSCSFQSDSGTSSPCEARTPDQLCYEPFDFSEETVMTLDPQNLELISRLAYLQTVDSVKKELFAPNASDVFLCENLVKDSTVTPTSPTIHFAPELPPSSICSQALSEFAFDMGPFWDPLL